MIQPAGVHRTVTVRTHPCGSAQGHRGMPAIRPCIRIHRMENPNVPLLRLRCVFTTAMTSAEVARDAALLDAEASEKLRRLKFADDRRDYAAAHGLLRRTLTSAAPNIVPVEWRFERTASGKPYLP